MTPKTIITENENGTYLLLTWAKKKMSAQDHCVQNGFFLLKPYMAKEPEGL